MEQADKGTNSSGAREVIVFDLDDTLYPEVSYVLSGFRVVDVWLTDNEGIGGFFDVAKKHFDNGRRGNIFDQTLSELEVPRINELVPKLVEIYRNHSPLLKLHPDADWILQHLAPSARTGLITDGYLSVQRKKVEALGLMSRIEAIIYSDLYGREHWKPSPTPYCRLIEVLGCEHCECIYISDNPRKDFVTARKLGWVTVQILRQDGEYRNFEVPPDYQADHLITTLYDFPAVMSEIKQTA